MGYIISLSVFGLMCLIMASWMFGKEKRETYLGIALLLTTVVSFYFAIDAMQRIPNGLPPELKTDGLYEVRIVDVYKEENGGQWVAFQVLKEQGNTITGRLPYRKIPKSKFGNANIVYGIPLTIELKTFPSQQYLAVK